MKTVNRQQSTVNSIKKKIKLMVVTPYFYPKIGGMENYALNISKELKKTHNYDVVVVTSNHEGKEYIEEMVEGLKVYRLPIQFKVSNTPINFKWKKMIGDIIDSEKPDIINAHSPVPFIADVAARVAKKKCVPFLLTYHTGSMKKGKLIPDTLIWIYENIILKKTIKLSKKVICCSDFVKNEFMNKYTDNCVTITPAVDTKLFYPGKKDNKNNEVLFVGNLNKSDSYKSVDILIESIGKVKKNIKDVKLVLVGEGDNIDYYKTLAEENGLGKDFILTGKLHGKNLAKRYKASSLLVLPSTKESFGMVLIEAMASSKPVIGTDIEGIPYVISKNKDGLLVKPRDSKDLSKAIINVLSNKKLAKELGENGLKKVKENYIWNVKTGKLSEIIGGILK